MSALAAPLQVEAPFSRSVRALSGDGYRTTLVLLSASVVCFGLWLVWFLRSRVPVYEVSHFARTEASSAPLPIQPACDGQVLRSELVLGRDVVAGEILVELDARAFEIDLRREQALLASLRSQLEALDAEREEVEHTYGSMQEAARVSLQEADARLREARAEARLTEGDARRSAALHTTGIGREADRERAEAEAESRRAAAERFELARARIELEEAGRLSQQRTALERLRGDMERLKGDSETCLARMQRLEHEIGRRRVTAPVDGRLGFVVPLGVGQVVEEGDHVATLVPVAPLGVVAEFPAESSVGRIRAGQRAWFRAEAFPWANRGRFPAVVRSVASEPTSGAVRVELALVDEGEASAALQHGLSGSAEVEIERVAPVELVLRAAHARLRVTSRTPELGLPVTPMSPGTEGR